MTDQEILDALGDGTFHLVKTKQGGVYGSETTPMTVGLCYDPERTTEEPVACIGKRKDGGYTLNFNVDDSGGASGVVIRFEDIDTIIL